MGLLLMLAILQAAWADGPEQDQVHFPGIAWGVPLVTVRRLYALERTAVEGKVERYAFPLNRLGGADLDERLFEFTDGRFSGIILTTLGTENTRALHRYLVRRFGTPSDDGHRFWQWMAGETYVSLDQDSAGDGYVLWYGIRWQHMQE